MKKILGALFFLVFGISSGIFLLYVYLPTPSYPSNPTNSLESQERGDTEDYKNRRAYFTDLTRAEVLEHHQKELSSLKWRNFEIPLPTYRLNYPPEDAMIYIKELTRSWYLEEIVHPFRESFFVNGFIPQVAKDAIIIEGREFQEKVTIRYYRSELWVRVGLALLSIILLFVLLREWCNTLFAGGND